jgi:hypothetical protein
MLSLCLRRRECDDACDVLYAGNHGCELIRQDWRNRDSALDCLLMNREDCTPCRSAWRIRWASPLAANRATRIP